MSAPSSQIPAGDQSRRPPVRIIKARERVLSDAELAVSIVIAFEDIRAQPDHVLSWTRGQTLPEQHYEVIVVSDGRHLETEKEIARHLRPQDVLVRSQGTERFELCNVGAEVARGEILLFTEDHCVAEPGGVELAAKVIHQLDKECVTLGWGHINANYVGMLEERVTDGNRDLWHAPGHWNKLRARGFVITRRAFKAVGGFPPGRGMFAEALFAARLHQQGVEAAVVPEVGLRHVNSHSLAELGGHARDYSYHECQASGELEPEFFHRYFSIPEVTSSALIPPREARRIVPLVGRELMREAHPHGRTRRWPRIAAWLGLLLRILTAGYGSVGTCWRARMALWRSWWGCQIWRFDEKRRYAAFASFWLRVVDHTRVSWLLSRRRPAILSRGNPPGDYRGEGLAGLRAWGMHALERQGDTPLRWTGGVGVIPLELPPGDYEVTFESAGLRGGDCRFPFVVYWGRHRIGRQSLRHHRTRVSFDITSKTPEGRTCLLCILVPVSLRSEADLRALGFPFAGLEVRPVKERWSTAQMKKVEGSVTARS
jgi:hypothetical protein